jgi:hemoglobin-like flavoprotein
MQSLMPDQIFISYAHQDKPILDEFLKHLESLQARNFLSVWSDDRIRAGADWRDEIRGALATARVALLLVSPDFLRSKFIQDEELSPLLAAKRAGETVLYWVPVSQSVAAMTELGNIQALTSRPLDELSPHDRQTEIIGICKRLHAEMGQLPELSRDRRAALGRTLQARLGSDYRVIEELGTGASSICYKAEQNLGEGLTRPVIVKTPVLSGFRPEGDGEFTRRMSIAQQLRDPAYISLYASSFDASPRYVVTEYVNGRSFDRFLASYPFVPARYVRLILLSLARALREAHDAGYLHEGLMPSNILIDHEHRPRVSAFRFLGRESQGNPWGTFVINHEICTYMSPEQFEGESRSESTDQYALGLLGHELLAGRPIPRVTRAADFADRRSVFEQLASGGALTARPPELCGVVSRMLGVKPEDRWTTMADVVQMLENVPVADSFEESYRTALASYARFQAPGRAHTFCASLYADLFRRVPELEALFKGDKTRQYRMLNQALKLLIDYAAAPADHHASIQAIVEGHRGYALTSQQLSAFLEAFMLALTLSGESDPKTLDAWHDVLTNALEPFGLELDEISERESIAPTLRKPSAGPAFAAAPS